MALGCASARERRSPRDSALTLIAIAALGCGGCSAQSPRPPQGFASEPISTTAPQSATTAATSPRVTPSSPSSAGQPPADTAETTSVAQASGTPGAPPGQTGAAAAPVPPPGGEGDVSQTVPVEEQEELPPAEPDDAVAIDSAVTVEITLGQTEVQARAPGEIGGDAVQVDVQLTNNAEAPIDLAGVSVIVDDHRGRPLSPLYNDPYDPVRGDLAPGSSVTGSYVFTLDDTVVQPLTISVGYAADQPVAVFVGGLQ